MKFSTIIGNAFGKAKQAVSAFFGKQKKNKYSSIARSIYLSAGAFLQGQKRPGHVTLTLTDRIITRSYGHTVIRSYGIRVIYVKSLGEEKESFSKKPFCSTHPVVFN